MQPMCFPFKALKNHKPMNKHLLKLRCLCCNLNDAVGNRPRPSFSGGNSPNDQIHDAVVEHLPVGVIIGDLLLLFLNLLHQLLSLDHQDVVRNAHKSLNDSWLTCALLLVMM